MGLWIAYAIVGFLTMLIFQVAIKVLQDGKLSQSDQMFSFFCGIVWPISYVSVAMLAAILFVTDGFEAISDKIYLKIKEKGWWK